MPKLKCDAHKCIYNCDRFCSKSVIHVNNDVDTKKCESFSVQKYNGYKYDTEFGCMDNSINQYVSIECDAKECDYNCKGMCVSENVKIGNENATSKSETKCETFSL